MRSVPAETAIVVAGQNQRSMTLWLLRVDLTQSQCWACRLAEGRQSAGHRVVIVSSGAIGVGCLRLGLKERPSAIAQKQALAAVGQVHLMRYYEDFFSAVGLV